RGDVEAADGGRQRRQDHDARGEAAGRQCRTRDRHGDAQDQGAAAAGRRHQICRRVAEGGRPVEAAPGHLEHGQIEEETMAKGILIAAMDFSAAPADEFHDWYDLEHVPERLAIPGFLNAERWIGIDNAKISLATYDLAE